MTCVVRVRRVLACMILLSQRVSKLPCNRVYGHSGQALDAGSLREARHWRLERLRSLSSNLRNSAAHDRTLLRRMTMHPRNSTPRVTSPA